jgi:uncharacterized protein (TIGR00255 family)
MTGFGEAHCEKDGLAVSIEVRTINSRYLKVSVRTSEGYGALEPLVESTVRSRIRRATAQVNIRVDQSHLPEDYRINAAVLEGYRQQLESLSARWPKSEQVPLANLLMLPGVVAEAALSTVDVSANWPVIEAAVLAALENLDRMRCEEGRKMADDLAANCRAIAASLTEVERRAPLVKEGYRAKLEERLKRSLAELNVALDEAGVIREVSLFADRSDISEETVRLRSHLDQFDSIMQAPESSGRKLEFLTQEMIREANTIGSKANDVEIARHVIEIKTAVERIREMIQNVE